MILLKEIAIIPNEKGIFVPKAPPSKTKEHDHSNVLDKQMNNR